jgi:hypothetical protein
MGSKAENVRFALSIALAIASVLLVAPVAGSARSDPDGVGCHWVGVLQMSRLTRHPRFTSRYAYVIRNGVRYCLSLGEIEIGDGHWIDSISDDGSVITLEDGSVWLVSPVDTVDTSIWLDVDNITVAHSHDPLYPYLLINTDEGETAHARFLTSS